MTHYRQILIIAAIALAAVASARAEGFSTMDVEEISSLIDAQEASASLAVSAKGTAQQAGQVSLTAGDMVSKVYDIVDPDAHKEECVHQARKVLGLTPQEDSDALWLESADGFVVDYYGMRPQVSAMARYDNGSERKGVADYGYFSYFLIRPTPRQAASAASQNFAARCSRRCTTAAWHSTSTQPPTISSRRWGSTTAASWMSACSTTNSRRAMAASS